MTTADLTLPEPPTTHSPVASDHETTESLVRSLEVFDLMILGGFFL